MTHFKTLALMSAALLPVVVPAFAADVISPLPMELAPVVQAAPKNNWEAGYIGGYLGGAINTSKNDFSDSTGKKGSVKLGGYAGWNFQNDNIVYGVEGDAGYNSFKEKDEGLSVNGGFEGSLRARLGYDMGVVMPYITAGVAGAQFNTKTPADSVKQFRVGWTTGVGAETMLTEKVSARLEYRFADFGKKDVRLDNEVFSGTKLQSHDIRVGVGYKF